MSPMLPLTLLSVLPVEFAVRDRYMEPELLHRILESPPLDKVVDYFSPFHMSKPYFKMLPLCQALLIVLFRRVSPPKTLPYAACRMLGKISRVLQRLDS
jgi:hypothetical protein